MLWWKKWKPLLNKSGRKVILSLFQWKSWYVRIAANGIMTGNQWGRSRRLGKNQKIKRLTLKKSARSCGHALHDIIFYLSNTSPTMHLLWPQKCDNMLINSACLYHRKNTLHFLKNINLSVFICVHLCPINCESTFQWTPHQFPPGRNQDRPEDCWLVQHRAA